MPPHSPSFCFTVDAEEWFASRLIATTAEERADISDFVEPMEFLLATLARFGVRGTFFFVYASAVKYPDIVRRVVSGGHEVALHGEEHDNVLDLGPVAFRDMVRRMRSAFRDRFALDVVGYRAPHFGMTPEGLRILAEEGYRYDSSTVPSLPIPGWYGDVSAPRTPYAVGSLPLWECPVSVHPWLRIPGGGGYYFRNLGYWWTAHVLTMAINRLRYGMFYVHPWELSRENPKRPGVPFYTFRRTGDWARVHLAALLTSLVAIPGLRSVTVAEVVDRCRSDITTRTQATTRV